MNDIFARAAYLERARRAEDEYFDVAHRDFLRVPNNFKRLDPSRQIKAIISDPTIDDYNRSFSPAGMDAERYLQLSRAVFFEHNTDVGAVAWCVALDVHADSVQAVAQFPPAGAHELSDFVWDRIRSGEVRAASIGPAGDPDISALLARAERYSTWELREWSLCEGQHGANPAAQVIEIGGRPLHASPGRQTPPRLAAAPRASAPRNGHGRAKYAMSWPQVRAAALSLGINVPD